MVRTKNDVSQPNVSIGLVCWIENNSQLPELERCLDSLTDFYPVIVINGKWSDFEGNNARSTQEAEELIDSYSNTIQLSSPNKPESFNRNLYLIQAGKMGSDYLIHIDSDEYIEMPLGKEFFLRGLEDTFSESKKLYAYAHCYDVSRGGNFRTAKIIRYPMFLRHKNKHNELFFNNTNVYKDVESAPRGLIVHHSKNFRSEEKQQQMINRRKTNPIH